MLTLPSFCFRRLHHLLLVLLTLPAFCFRCLHHLLLVLPTPSALFDAQTFEDEELEREAAGVEGGESVVPSDDGNTFDLGSGEKEEGAGEAVYFDPAKGNVVFVGLFFFPSPSFLDSFR